MSPFASRTRPALRRLARLAAAALLLAPAAAAAQAKSRPLTEPEVKAAFLYNFARFVQWPGSELSLRVDLCVVGGDPFGGALRTIEGKPLGQAAALLVRRVDPGALSGCNLVFIPASEKDRLGQVLQAAKGGRLLTIGDGPDFAQSGTVIGLYPDGNTIRFEINVDAARRSRLAISSQLLRLARITHDRNATP